MFELKSIAACAAICVLAAGTGSGQTNESTWDWTTASPESQGMSGKRLDEMRDVLAARSTTGLLVIRNDKIVCEWYDSTHSVASLQSTASMAKAVVGGVSTAVVLGDGLVALDDKVSKYVPQWLDDPRKSRITLRELGSHTSGLSDAEIWDDVNQKLVPHGEQTGWTGDFWKGLPPPRDPFTLARDQAPVLFEPGEKFEYSNPGIAMLVYSLTTALKDAPDKDIRSLLRDRVMRPIGVKDSEWSIGARKTFTVDGLPLVTAWGGADYTARALARLAKLMLQGGNWNGKQLLSAKAVHSVTTHAGTPGICAVGWWSNHEGKWPELPKDAFWGSGAGHKTILVVPSLKLIAVRFGQNIAPVPPALVRGPENAHPTYLYLFKPLMEAITDRGPSAAAGTP